MPIDLQNLRAPLVLGLGLLSLQGCGEPRTVGAGALSVLVITVDGLRADHLGAYGADPATAPHLDRLAESSVRYAYALAPSPWAAPSFAALWSGRYPSELGFTDLDRPLRGQVQTLAESMAAEGWETAAVVSHAFAGGQTGLDQGFQEWIELPAEQRTDTDVTRAAIGVLESASGPNLLWVQYSGLRLPFDQPVPAGDYDGPIETGQSRQELLRLAPSLEASDAVRLGELYDAELALVDQEVGRLLAALGSSGRQSQTVVLLTSPHGCELLERGGVGDAATLRDEIVRVPLLLRVPGGRSGVIQDPVSLVDVVPTLRACTGGEGLPVPSGLSVLPGSNSPERRLYSETSRARELRAVLDGDWKLIVDQGLGESQLFDVFEDPRETKNAADSHGQVRVRLESELAAFEAGLAQ